LRVISENAQKSARACGYQYCKKGPAIGGA
jgi:hypothetical protein